MITELSVLLDRCTIDTMPSMAALHVLRHANYQLFLNLLILEIHAIIYQLHIEINIVELRKVFACTVTYTNCNAMAAI